MRAGLLRPQRKGRIETGASLLETAKTVEQERTAEMGVGEIGPQLERARVSIHRVLAAAQLSKDEPKIAVQTCNFRRKRDGALQRGRRLRIAARSHELARFSVERLKALARSRSQAEVSGRRFDFYSKSDFSFASCREKLFSAPALEQSGKALCFRAACSGSIHAGRA